MSDHGDTSPPRRVIAPAGPSISEREVHYVTDAVRNGFYGEPDRYVRRLERAIADRVNCRFAVATHCCTHALHLACAALGIARGDEVLCPEITWIASAYAIMHAGGNPVPVDIDPATWCIDVASAERALTSRTRAVMVVHAFGHPAEMDAVLNFAARHGLSVIEDAAPALGSTYRGRDVGGLGTCGCFSFQSQKIAVSGQGGALVTNDETLYDRARRLSVLGRTDSQARYWSDELGYNYGMGNVAAAVALAQVERVDELVLRKRQIAGWYKALLQSEPRLHLVDEPPGSMSNFCYPPVLVVDDARVERDQILRGLLAAGIEARPSFPRLSDQPVVSGRVETPAAAAVAKRGFLLPAALDMDENDVERVALELRSILENG